MKNENPFKNLVCYKFQNNNIKKGFPHFFKQSFGFLLKIVGKLVCGMNNFSKLFSVLKVLAGQKNKIYLTVIYFENNMFY